MDPLLVCCMLFQGLINKKCTCTPFSVFDCEITRGKSCMRIRESLLRQKHLRNRVVASVCSSPYLMQNTKAKLGVLLKDTVPNNFLDESELSYELQGISESKSYPSKEITH